MLNTEVKIASMKWNDNIQVSVLIPAYNEEKYIIKTLTALVKQDYHNYEIIVVNNASTDNTALEVETFINANRESGITITLLYEARKGTNFAREKGRLFATGDIIAQLDADCVPGRSWISNGVRSIMENEVVAVTGPYYYFDAPFFTRISTLISQLTMYTAINAITQIAKRGGIIIGGNAFIDALVLAKAGGYNTELTFYGDDVDIAARIAPFGWIEYSNRLILKSSFRRFAAIGFWKVTGKYQKFFWDTVLLKRINIQRTMELNHPR